ncbi:LysR family transcriptional regulator ArgP [Maridesulfovibrio salexigens]|uniref:Transcriptional regulator, LysR family n=1 Tax=Maridesulfovibrio salexigens (strain ATCC 14822 / DSM 2638 / NCIMB 8403 / VKM B-1763) TaxID=526222 RepID=C6BY65_MARSD|nr:LysR family transcriptional regulator ArgP [Maridesulfovibrio salexigens]ACS80595.1 transcriptional regulator, LysR family [Maridesulfovibrio salexigens DSM 2638]
MLDNIFLEALAAVIEEGGFDKAALKLNISQSAVSQRIRNFEEQLGRVLVVRATPPEPTEDGRKLIKHLHTIRLMEHDLNDSMGLNPSGEFVTLPVGVNADSLATWFLDALDGFLKEHNVLLDLYVDDENRTHEMLARGEVVGCIGTVSKPVKGCRSDYLATFDYLCLSTPDFYKRWFKDGFNRESVAKAPAAVFNRKDETQSQMLEKLFPGDSVAHPIFYIPSTESFVDIICRELAYGMVPEFQVEEELKSGQLIEVAPQGRVPVSLYWHSWNVETKLLEGLRRELVGYFNKNV